MIDLVAFITSPTIQPIVIAITIVIVDRLWQIPESIHPLLFIKLVGIRMAEKVAKPQNHPKQQYTAGLLSALLLVMPWIGILYFFRQFTYYPIFFDALILFVSLQFGYFHKHITKVCDATCRGKKQLARELLTNVCLRKTNTLSQIGIVKAGFESLVLRFYYQQITVIFWFIVIGPYAALTYRMLLELHYAWNPKIEKYMHFGAFTSKICSSVQYLPVRLGSFIAVFINHIHATLSFYSPLKFGEWVFAPNGKVILASESLISRLHFSGPVIYNSEKYRRKKFLGKREPHYKDIKRVVNALNYTLVLFLAIMSIINGLLTNVFLTA